MGVVRPTKGRRPYNGFSCVLVKYRPLDAAKLPSRPSLPFVFFLRCRGNARNMRIDGFALSFVLPKKKNKKRKKHSPPNPQTDHYTQSKTNPPRPRPRKQKR